MKCTYTKKQVQSTAHLELTPNECEALFKCVSLFIQNEVARNGYDVAELQTLLAIQQATYLGKNYK